MVAFSRPLIPRQALLRLAAVASVSAALLLDCFFGLTPFAQGWVSPVVLFAKDTLSSNEVLDSYRAWGISQIPDPQPLLSSSSAGKLAPALCDQCQPANEPASGWGKLLAQPVGCFQYATVWDRGPPCLAAS